MSRKAESVPDLDRLDALERAATKGPWLWATSNSHRRLMVEGGRDGGVAHGDNHPVDRHPDIAISEEDMAVIAEGRNALRWLIERARRASELEVALLHDAEDAISCSCCLMANSHRVDAVSFLVRAIDGKVVSRLAVCRDCCKRGVAYGNADSLEPVEQPAYVIRARQTLEKP